MNDAAKPARGELALASGFVDGDDAADFERVGNLLFCGAGVAVVGRVADDLELRLHELQLAVSILFDLAVESDDLAGLKAIAQVSGVEPDALQPGAALPGSHLENGHAAGFERAQRCGPQRSR